MTAQSRASGRENETALEASNSALLSIVTAFTVCGDAINRDDLSGRARLERLTEAHGALMAACGPGHHVPFAGLLDRLTGNQAGSLEGLLPAWIDTTVLEDVRLLDEQGIPTEDGFDYQHEAAHIAWLAQKINRRSGHVTIDALTSEYSQEAVFRAIKGAHYAHHRASLIENASARTSDLADLNLPTRAIGFYQPIARFAQHDGWWFPCPACRWPMKITVKDSGRRPIADVRCLYPFHAETGATFTFRVQATGRPPALHPTREATVPPSHEAALWTGATEEVPQALPVEGFRALVRPVWRYTVISGLSELRLFQVLEAALDGTGFQLERWPDGDRIDVRVASDDLQELLFPGDVKDFTWSNTLIRKIHLDGGDKGHAKYLIVPDNRRHQVDQLNAVCRGYGMAAMTTTDYMEMVLRHIKGGLGDE